jgi:predicted small metal-binding protein
MPFSLKCADFLSPECTEEITGENADEVMQKMSLHAADVHQDTEMTPERREAAAERMLWS